jgi:hypothetical protein
MSDGVQTVWLDARCFARGQIIIAAFFSAVRKDLVYISGAIFLDAAYKSP